MKEINEILADKNSDYLLTLPEVTDKDLLSVIRILHTIFTISYFCSVDAMSSVVTTALYLHLKNGVVSDYAPPTFSFFGMVLAEHGEHSRGYTFGEMGLMLLQQRKSGL